MGMHRTTYLFVCHHFLNFVPDFVLHLIPPTLLSPTFRLNHSGLPPTRLSHLLHQLYGINYLLPFAHPTRFIRLRGYCTPGQFLDFFCIFLKNYNTLVTTKICSQTAGHTRDRYFLFQPAKVTSLSKRHFCRDENEK